MVRVTRHRSYNHSTRRPCFLRNATQALEQPGSSLGSKQDAKPSLNNPSEPPPLHALPPPPLRILLSSSGQEMLRTTRAATVTITATQQQRAEDNKPKDTLKHKRYVGRESPGEDEHTFVVSTHLPGQSCPLGFRPSFCHGACDGPQAEQLFSVVCAVCGKEPQPCSRAFFSVQFPCSVSE